MVLKLICSYFSCFIVSIATYALEANNLTPDLKSNIKHGYPIFQVGWARVTAGKDQHASIVSSNGNQYTVTNGLNSNVILGAGYLIDGQQYDKFKLSYGLNAFYLAKTSVSGYVYQQNIYNNLTYSYTNTYYPLYALAKAIFDKIHPNYAFTIDLGIGPDFIWSSNYREMPVFTSIEPDNAFSSNITTSFAAIAGAGIRFKKIFGQELPLECGYRFLYLGQGNLKIQNDLYQEQLATGRDYANSIMCTVAL